MKKKKVQSTNAPPNIAPVTQRKERKNKKTGGAKKCANAQTMLIRVKNKMTEEKETASGFD
jgi:hypothetical protein